MSVTARHAGRVNEQGLLVLADPAAWRAACAKNKGRAVWLTVTRQTHARSLPANRYYWGVVVDSIAGFIGEDRKTVHEYLKTMFLPKREIELLDGQHMTVSGSTRLLSVEEFAEYVNRCRVWAAQFLGLALPDANQVEVAL